MLKRDTFTEASATALGQHASDQGASWSGADTTSFTVVGGQGVVQNTTPDRRVALGSEPVTTPFQVVEVTGRPGATGELGAVCGWSGSFAAGTGTLLRINGTGEASLATVTGGAVDTLATWSVPGFDATSDHTLQLLCEPAGTSWSMIAARLDGVLMDTDDDGPRSMYRHLPTRRAAGAPGLYARSTAARITAVVFSSTTGLSDGSYTWPNVTLPYRVPMNGDTPTSGPGGINSRVTMGEVVAGRSDCMKVDLSAKTIGVEGYGGTPMGQPTWGGVNDRPQRVSIRWQQYLGTTLNHLRGFKQQIVIGAQLNGGTVVRRGAVIVSFSTATSLRDIGIGLPASQQYSPAIVLGQWQEFEAVYDYAGQVARLYRHDNRAGEISSYSLTGFNDSYIQMPEGLGWYWDDDHGGPNTPQSFSATRAVRFAAAYQGPSN